MKALIVCGPSGSGKSTLVKHLVRQYPDKYIKAVQYTTRPRREGESPNEYRFVTPEEFKKVASSLAGITHVNGNTYGSEILPFEKRIQIFILNKEGIADFRYISACLDGEIEVLGVSRNFHKCCEARPSRTPEFIREEFKTLALADAVYDNDKEISPENLSDLNTLIDSLFK
jgi:energy-coupling factor transporter ATP-binding protein EcfA2